MEIIDTPLKDCYLIKNNIFHDSRGYFFESFNRKIFAEKTGLDIEFVQDNQSFSGYGVVRGLHFQKGPWAQAKLIRVLKGKVLDVALDLRPNYPSFGKTFCVELSDDNAFQLFIPKGVAHGFSVLSDEAVFFYKCDNYFHKAAESGIYPLDDTLGIDWRIEKEKMVLSDKDRSAPSWLEYLISLNQ